MTYQLDHIAVVCSDLEIGAAWLAGALGVRLQAGGAHARFGTHNRLLGLADGLYLEVIAPDPAASVIGPRWFGLDDAPALPRWGNWICRAADVHAKPDLAGPAVAMSRGDLRWDITVPDDGQLPMNGGFPTLIKWQNPATHPAVLLPDSGCRLIRWEVFHPQAATIADLCNMDDPRIVFTQSDQISFAATIDTPSGVKVVQ